MHMKKKKHGKTLKAIRQTDRHMQSCYTDRRASGFKMRKKKTNEKQFKLNIFV